MKKEKILSRFLSLTIILGFGFYFPLEAQSQVTLAVGNGSGLPGSSGNEVALSLENPDDNVGAIQVDICDKDDYLSITGVETTSRTKGFNCDYNEISGGCGRMFIISFNLDSIEKGSGPVFIVKYDVKKNAPFEECRELNPENVMIIDETNRTLEATKVPGEFCFTSSCKLNINPSSKIVGSEETIQFSASNTGNCKKEPVYRWEVESEIGSKISDGGLYIAGINDNENAVTDTVTVYDTSNVISATAGIIVEAMTESPCRIIISPDKVTVGSEETIQFSASNKGDCKKEPVYRWEVESEIGSKISDGGLYTAGINNTGMEAVDVVTVYDAANIVSAIASITVLPGAVQHDGIINEVWPGKILGSRWIPIFHLISITGKNTHFNRTSKVTFTPGEDIKCIKKFRFGKKVLVLLIRLNPNPLVGSVDVSVTTTIEQVSYTVNGEDMIEIGLLPFIFNDKDI